MVTEVDYTEPQEYQKISQNVRALGFEGNVKGSFYGSGTINVASLADGAGATETLTVPGVALGDAVAFVSAGVDLAGITVTPYVSAANTVSIRVQNESGGVVDLASTTFRVGVYDLT